MVFGLTEERDRWIKEQLTETNLYNETELKKVRKFYTGGLLLAIGFICMIFVITIPIGIILIPLGTLICLANFGGRKRFEHYNEVSGELKQEWIRRKKSGESLYEPVSDEWWKGRIKEEYRPPHLREDTASEQPEEDHSEHEAVTEQSPGKIRGAYRGLQSEYRVFKQDSELQAKYGGVKMHLVVVILTAWWTAGLGNIAYALWRRWKYSEPQEPLPNE